MVSFRRGRSSGAIGVRPADPSGPGAGSERRRKVVRALGARPDDDSQAIAGMMEEGLR